jgi:hypothetical protein
VGVKRHAPAVLPPGRTRYPLYRRLGWPQDHSGRVIKLRYIITLSPYASGMFLTGLPVKILYVFVVSCACQPSPIVFLSS